MNRSTSFTKISSSGWDCSFCIQSQLSTHNSSITVVPAIIAHCPPAASSTDFTNGEAERFVRTFKEAMKTTQSDGLTLPHRINNFLLTYRTTPHTTTGTPPCELPMGRSLRTRWDLLKPSTNENVRRRQATQKSLHDQHAWWRCMSIAISS